MKKVMFLVAGMLAASSVVVPHSANAAGCLKGAMVGGVAGHYAGHHGLLGAGIGCAYGHHEAAKHEREQVRQDRDRY